MEQRQPSSEEAFISEMQDLTGLSGPVTGLVAEGGGMKCAYGAGVLDAFLDDGLQFPYCIGVSAGSANVASYLGGQRGRNIRFYVEHTQERDYFGAGPFVKTGNMFNLRYIYGTLSNSTGADPLDFARVMKNPARFRIVATDDDQCAFALADGAKGEDKPLIKMFNAFGRVTLYLNYIADGMNECDEALKAMGYKSFVVVKDAEDCAKAEEYIRAMMKENGLIRYPTDAYIAEDGNDKGFTYTLKY